MAEPAITAKKKLATAFSAWLEPLRNINLLALLSASTISKLGDYIFKAIISWYILNKTGSAMQMGFVLIASSLPAIILLPLSGVLLDRIPHKTALLLNNIMQALFIAGLAIVIKYDYFNLQLFFFALAIIGTLEVLAVPNVNIYLLELLPKKSLLHATNSLNLLGSQLASIAGPLIAAYFYEYIGAANGILVNSLTFLAFCILIVPIKTDAGNIQNASSSKDNLFKELLNGFNYIKTVPWMCWALFIIVIQNSVNSGVWAIGIPALVKFSLNANMKLMAIIYSMGAFGAVIGLCMAGILDIKNNRGMLLITSVITTAIGMWLLLAKQIHLVCLAGFIRGFALAFFHLYWNSIFMSEVADEHRGKVLSLFTWAALCFVPVGIGAVGIYIEYFGIEGLIQLAGASLMMLAISMLALTSIRRI